MPATPTAGACTSPVPAASLPLLQDPGLHVVEADGGDNGSGSDASSQQHGQDVKGAQQGGGGGKGTGDDAALFASTDGRKAGAVEEQQQEGSDEGEQVGQQVGQQAQQAQQQQQQAQAHAQQQQQQAQQQVEQQQQQRGGSGSPSKFAQALQRQREEAAANRKQVRQPVPTSFPAQPEPEVVELSPEEVARCAESCSSWKRCCGRVCLAVNAEMLLWLRLRWQPSICTCDRQPAVTMHTHAQASRPHLGR